MCSTACSIRASSTARGKDMTTTAAPVSGTPSRDEVLLARKPRSLWGDAWRQFRRHRLAMFGLVLLSLLVVCVGIGPFIWNKNASADLSSRRKEPSIEH